MRTIVAELALLPEGWRERVAVAIGDDGHIARVEANAAGEGARVGVLLPAPSNLHSHSFQRAMAGLTERRGPDPRDTFWTWRQLMYCFLDGLDPDDIEAIAALVFMEMLEAGYAAVAEFHYLHHQPGGAPYANLAETAERICAAATTTGIGLTLLPVLYERGGCDGRALGPGQIRFGNDVDRFGKLLEAARRAVASGERDWGTGVAPHSLRAVSPEGLAAATRLMPDAPIHMHIAEQTAEVEEVKAAWGARPVEWLFQHREVGPRWCLIHATHMEPGEVEKLARSGAVAGLCPITESSLGDGIFEATAYLKHGGRLGVGSDSNLRIALSEELRTLEYSQRLRDRGRAMLATAEKSAGRVLFDHAVAGGAQALQRNSGAIGVGRLADLVALDRRHVDLAGRKGDVVLDTYVFAGDDRMVSDVWSAGRHVVASGRHIARDRILPRYAKSLAKLGQEI